MALVAIIGFAMAAALDRTGFPATDLLAAVAIFAGPWFAAWLISPTSIGFGDIKLSAGLGLYLGWLGPDVAFGGLIAASALAGVVALVPAALGRKGGLLPFGPALVGGAVVAAALDTLIS